MSGLSMLGIRSKYEDCIGPVTSLLIEASQHDPVDKIVATAPHPSAKVPLAAVAPAHLRERRPDIHEFPQEKGINTLPQMGKIKIRCII